MALLESVLGKTRCKQRQNLYVTVLALNAIPLNKDMTKNDLLLNATVKYLPNPTIVWNSKKTKLIAAIRQIPWKTETTHMSRFTEERLHRITILQGKGHLLLGMPTTFYELHQRLPSQFSLGLNKLQNFYLCLLGRVPVLHIILSKLTV